MIRRRRLPHFHTIGQPLFLTFCLHRSLPATRPFRPENLTSGEAFVTMDRLLDHARSGPMFLRQPPVAELVCESILYGTEIRHYDLHAWAVMPNHVHLLVTPLISPSKVLNALKGGTAHRANRFLHRSGRFWQDESYDHLVRTEEEFRRTQLYIENNPVKAGLITTPEQYPYSSAGRPERPPQARRLPHKTAVAGEL